MLHSIFQEVLNMSIASSLLVIVILIYRVVFRKFLRIYLPSSLESGEDIGKI